MEDNLTQLDFEDLSAYMDGELAEPVLSRVRGLVETSPAWRRALEELRSLDRALESCAVPAPDSDLAARILRRTSHAHRVVWLPRSPLRWLAPLAAAAAFVAALLIFQNVTTSHRNRGPIARKTPAPLPVASPNRTDNNAVNNDGEDAPLAADKLAQDNLDLFRDMGVVENFDTIEAIYREQRNEGT